MLSSFWEAAGAKLADRWAAVSIPALVFWFGGLLAWIHSQRGFHALKEPAAWLARQSAPAQITIVLITLLGVSASGVIIERLTTPVLRLLEGWYWPCFLKPLRHELVERKKSKAKEQLKRYQELSPAVSLGTASPEERTEYGRLTMLQRRSPSPSPDMPTRIGNTLRAAETRPVDKYGLDVVSVWPQLWLLLPDTARKEIATARVSLDASVAACIWGVLFVLFAPWTLWAVPAGLGVAVVAVMAWVPSRAEVYADLLEAGFDLYRRALYEQLRWPAPRNPRDERTQGELLTRYLVRGSDRTTPAWDGDR
ncbi:hypothetical protein CTU88_11230 [Streptomyces sp. JV178]|uniref:hypothetical protein n=1 Tax=Streptomyces sp. JV178 TaxID=858632 RepID=UPI000C1B5EE1|nr:hypothetical protein [Streptomyces sp. JV178]PIM72686.1 hypothetical protein CTU88_11230 [Streptomyces sp. JV178]